MKVLKFGGTSVANAEKHKVILRIINEKARDEKLIVVVSVLSKVTDLLQLASQKSSCWRRKLQRMHEKCAQKTPTTFLSI
jgi:aspartokinase